MKKILSYILVAFVAINITSCSKDDAEVVTKSTPKVEFTLAEEIKVGTTVTTTLEGGDGENYTATSSNESVATVSIDGKTLKVEAKTEGETTIKVTSGGESKEVKVIVSAYPNVSFTLSKEELIVGATATATLEGGDGENYIVASSDKSIVTASIDGKTLKVEAKAVGTVSITVTSGQKSKEVAVNVIPVLEEVGLYNLDGSSVFTIRSEVRKGNTSFGFFEKYNPTQGKKVVVDLLDSPEVGATVSLNVTSRDVTNLSGAVSAKVENISANTVQLKTDNYRLVIPKK